MVKEVFTS